MCRVSVTVRAVGNSAGAWTRLIGNKQIEKRCEYYELNKECREERRRQTQGTCNKNFFDIGKEI